MNESRVLSPYSDSLRTTYRLPLAVGLSLLAFILQVFVPRPFQGLVFFFHFPAVFLSAVWLGWKFGAISLLISVIGFWLLFLGGRPELGFDFEIFLSRIAAFTILSAGMIYFAFKKTQVHLALAAKELQLEKNEAEYRALFESAGIGKAELDSALKKFIKVNVKLAQILGLHRDDLLKQDFSTLIHPEDRPLLNAYMENLSNLEQNEWSVELRLQAKEAAEVWIKMHGTFVRNPENQIARCIVSIEDITESKRSREHQDFLSQAGRILSESLNIEKTLSALTQLSVPALADWCIVDLIQKDESIRRMEIASVDRKQEAWDIARRVLPSKDHPDHPPTRAILTGKTVFFETINMEDLERFSQSIEHKRALESLKLKSLVALPLIARGKTLGAITFATSSSKRQIRSQDLNFLEEVALRAALAVDNSLLLSEAREAMKVRDEFLAVASHELKTPITSMMLQSQLMERKLNSRLSISAQSQSQKLQGFVEQNIQSLKRLNRLVEDMLDISKLTGGKLSLLKTEVEVSDLIRRVVDQVQPHLREAHCHLVVGAEDHLVALIDRYRIEQVLVNLLMNAARNASKSLVEIHARSLDSKIQISVKDHGKGLSSIEQARIFNRYERLDERVSFGGLGLGLSICKEIIEMHGGKIELRSAPGKGAEFLILLPEAQSSLATFKHLTPKIAG